jgi:ribosomal protein L29
MDIQKISTFSSLLGLSEEELNVLLLRLKESVQIASLRNSVGLLTDTSIIRRLKRNVAEIRTILGQKQALNKKGSINA